MSDVAFVKKPIKVAPKPDAGAILAGDDRIPIHKVAGAGDSINPALVALLTDVATNYRWVSKASVEWGRGHAYDHQGGWWVIVDRMPQNQLQREDITNMLEGVVRGWNAAVKAKAREFYNEMTLDEIRARAV